MTKSISKTHCSTSSDVPIAHVINEWPGGLEQPAVIYPLKGDDARQHAIKTILDSFLRQGRRVKSIHRRGA
jgi:hypothetical protein